jgi:HlyD family secretion protein
MKRKIFKRFGIAAAFMLPALGVAFGIRQMRPAVKATPTVHVRRGSLEPDVDTAGELRTPHSVVLVAPPVNGSLQIVSLVKTGAHVKAGDVVVEFDPSEQEYNLEQNRSKLAEAEQQIAKAEADAAVKGAEDKVVLLKAKFDVRRAELEVGRNELASEIDARKNVLNLEEAKRRLAQLELDVKSRAASNTASVAQLEEQRQSALLAMKQAQRGIDSMRLTSPLDGLVSVRDNLDAGFAIPGTTLPQYREGDLVNTGRILAEVLDPDRMEIVAKVSESDRPNINVGQSAEVRLDARSGPPVAAKVKSVAGVAARNDFGADAAGRFEVLFSFVDRESNLHPGTSAEILVRGDRIENQLYLPAQCLFEVDGRQVVYVKQGSGFQAKEIKVKFRTANRIAVDLPEGTEVALVNPDSFKNADSAKVSGPVGVGR